MLRDEVDRWDPIGLYACGLRGEYECVLGDLYSALKGGSDARAIAELLEREFAAHYGSVVSAETFARHIISRWRMVARPRIVPESSGV